MTTQKKLYKSQTDRVLTGVVGGLGEYFDVDSTILRLVWILIVVFSGIFPGVIVYILAALVVPKKPEHQERESTSSSSQ